MREKVIEEYLRDLARVQGGIAFKFVSPGNSGVPDRLILLPGKRIGFVETKATGEKATPKQKLQQSRIARLGFLVATIDNKPDINEFIRGMINA